MKLTINFG